MSRLADLLAAATPQTFWQAIYASRFTGRLILDCQNGVPKVVEVPTPGERVVLRSHAERAPGGLTTARTPGTLNDV